MEWRTSKQRRSRPLQVLSAELGRNILDIIDDNRRWRRPKRLKSWNRESVSIAYRHQKIQNTIWSKVNWNGISTRFAKDLFASEASFLKPAPGSQSGTYFTGRVGKNLS